MAATFNFDRYLGFYSSNIQNYHKNGFFDPKNVDVDGLNLCITIILAFTYFSKILAAILDFFKFDQNGP